MRRETFSTKELRTLAEAVDIAEDMTSDYFRLSLSHWRQYPYDVRTLGNLFGEDIRDNAFALLQRYVPKTKVDFVSPYTRREFYLICVQDHQILRALQRDKELELLPLLAYVLTHELVHIVRFCKFQVRFDTEQEMSRRNEEKIVHRTTYEILKDLPLASLTYILGSYSPERINLDVCMA